MRRAAPIAVSTILVVTLAGCGSNGDAGREYTDKLTKAGFESVTVSPEGRTSNGRKNRDRKIVNAYDFDWTVNLDDDPTTCVVTLRHPARSSEWLRGDHWHIEEVNGDDVDGWGGGSPNPDTVRRLLREHDHDC